MSNILFDLLIKYHQSLISRDFIIDYFVESEFMTKEETIRCKMVKPGKLFQDNKKLYVITEALSKDSISSFEEIDFPEKKLSFYNKFHLKKGMIENFNDDTPIISTLGVYILNFLVLVKPFGNVISYVNEYWKLGDIEKEIVDAIKYYVTNNGKRITGGFSTREAAEAKKAEFEKNPDTIPKDK